MLDKVKYAKQIAKKGEVAHISKVFVLESDCSIKKKCFWNVGGVLHCSE